MYAAKHRNDEAYIPERDNSHAAVKAVTRESNAAPVRSPARNMHALLDSQFTLNAERLPSVEPFPPAVSLVIVMTFCAASWGVIAAVLLPILW